MPVVDTLRLKTKLSDIGMPELDFVQNEGHPGASHRPSIAR